MRIALARTTGSESVTSLHCDSLKDSQNLELDLVRQLEVWLHWMGLCVQPGCPKQLRCQARCLVCSPLFPRRARQQEGLPVRLGTRFHRRGPARRSSGWSASPAVTPAASPWCRRGRVVSPLPSRRESRRSSCTCSAVTVPSAQPGSTCIFVSRPGFYRPSKRSASEAIEYLHA